MGIVNVVGSTITREVDSGIYLHAGPETGVASTKAFTAQLVTIVLLAIYLARQRKMTIDTGMGIVEELLGIPKKIEEILKQKEQHKAACEKI